MLKETEIINFIRDDLGSEKKRFAKIGENYYEGDHDIRFYKLYYYNADGILTEDTTRANIKIAHPYFTELVDQTTQYMLSGKDGFIKSDNPELQTYLDEYFNKNENFKAELYDLLTDSQSKGFGYMYAYKNADDKTAFQCADSLGIVEVRAKDTDDNCDYIIFWYVDRIDKGHKVIKRIQVWDNTQTIFYVQKDDGQLEPDECYNGTNIRPHITYKKDNDDSIYYDSYGFIPFFRIDNCKKQFSSLKPIKALIDDYDLHACSLSNNLVDFDTPLYAVRGFQGDDLDELIQNVKTKKHIGLDVDGGIDIQTVNIPFEARKTKLELDEKNIYRFGMGLNTAGLKDTSATTNIAIQTAYALLDMKCNKIQIKLEQFLRKILKVVLEEINRDNETDYQMEDIYFSFKREIMTNAVDNAQIELTKAQAKQAEITTLLNVASTLDNETIVQSICDILDIDYEKIKNKLPMNEQEILNSAQNDLNNVVVDE